MPEQHVPTSRPAPRFLLQHAFSGRDAAPDAIGAPLRPIPLVGLVIELLDRAAETVDSDRAEAKDCITRATSLLQRENSHTDRERGGATSDTGAWGPYALAGAPGEPAYRRSTGLDDQDGRLRRGRAIEHQPFPSCLQGHFRPDILQIRQPAAYRARSGADGDDGSAVVPDCASGAVSPISRTSPGCFAAW